MTPLVQNLIVAVLVTACGVIMGMRAYRMLRGRTNGCGCEQCPVQKRAPTVPPPVQRGA